MAQPPRILVVVKDVCPLPLVASAALHPCWDFQQTEHHKTDWEIDSFFFVFLFIPRPSAPKDKHFLNWNWWFWRTVLSVMQLLKGSSNYGFCFRQTNGQDGSHMGPGALLLPINIRQINGSICPSSTAMSSHGCTVTMPRMADTVYVEFGQHGSASFFWRWHVNTVLHSTTVNTH